MQPKKLDFIDSLRGFAALYVALFHFSLITNPAAAAPRWLAPLTGLGGSGVTLFFVVSAFTLCLSMDSRVVDAQRPLLNYFIRRFFRIAPLFYTWIILYCIRDKLVFDVSHPVSEILKSVVFVLNLSPGHEQGFVWASWTLGVEMLFYVLFPLFFWLANNIGKAAAVFLASLLLRAAWHLAVPHFVSDPAIAASFYNFSLLRHLPTFLFGILIYRIYRQINFVKAAQTGAGFFFVSLFWVALLSLCYGVISTGSFEGLTIEALLYGCLLLGLSITAPRFMVNPITRFYGKISYSVYLSHATTLYFLSPVFAVIYRHIPYVTAAYTLSLVVGIACVTVISYLTFRFVELPGQHIGRTIIKSRRQRSASA